MLERVHEGAPASNVSAPATYGRTDRLRMLSLFSGPYARADGLAVEDELAGGRGHAAPSFRVDTRSWGDHKKLELSPSPASYKAWRQRALDYLSRDREGYPRGGVRALLIWAESQGDDIDDQRVEAGAREVRLAEPAGPVVATLYPAIRGIIADEVMQRSERCTSGVELWRRLYTEMRGAAPQIAMVQAEQYQFPQRAPSQAALWDHLERWLAFGDRGGGVGV